MTRYDLFNADECFITGTGAELMPVVKIDGRVIGDGKPGKEDGKQARFFEPGGLAVLGDKLYIADTNNHLIRVADLKTREVTTLQIKLPKR